MVSFNAKSLFANISVSFITQLTDALYHKREYKSD